MTDFYFVILSAGGLILGGLGIRKNLLTTCESASL
jgi:hypothetical protein